MKCSHTIRFNKLCADCGEEIFTSQKLYNPLYSTDKLHTTKLKKLTKPLLVIDLDHTILFTSLNAVKEQTGVSQFSIGDVTYYVTFRPFLSEFIKKASRYFDLYIYTMGTRDYAMKILNIIDPNKIYFEDKVITRDENNNRLTKEIGRLGASSKHIIILDDRLDVWQYEECVILVKPFYLQHEKDFNDPKEIEKNMSENSNIVSCKKDGGGFVRKLQNDKCSGKLVKYKNDRELLKISRYLKKIFGKYRKIKNIKKILKKERCKIFKPFKFYFELGDPLIKLISFYGGIFLSKNKLSIDNNSFVLKEGKFWRLVKKKWIYKCIYERKDLPLKKYTIMGESFDDDDSDNSETKYYL